VHGLLQSWGKAGADLSSVADVTDRHSSSRLASLDWSDMALTRLRVTHVSSLHRVSEERLIFPISHLPATPPRLRGLVSKISYCFLFIWLDIAISMNCNDPLQRTVDPLLAPSLISRDIRTRTRYLVRGARLDGPRSSPRQGVTKTSDYGHKTPQIANEPRCQGFGALRR
jgi:hypothetical protein